jgi:hypothetical protein
MEIDRMIREPVDAQALLPRPEQSLYHPGITIGSGEKLKVRVAMNIPAS